MQIQLQHLGQSRVAKTGAAAALCIRDERTTYLLVSFACGIQGEVSTSLVLHELHIDRAPQRVALAKTNLSFALRPLVRPGHMRVLCCQTYWAGGSPTHSLTLSQAL